MNTRPDQDPTAWLALRPRDTVFVRDGRAFDAASELVATSVAPWPSTIAGAVRTAYGAEPREVRGPILARQEPSGGWIPHFPVPLDVVAETQTAEPYVFRLACTQLPGCTDLTPDPGAPEAMTGWLTPPPQVSGKVEQISGWLPAGDLAAYLAGAMPPADGVPRDEIGVVDPDPVVAEQRIGLALEPHARTTRSGFLYQAQHMRLADGWAYLAGCRLPASWKRTADGPVGLGGRTRLVDVEPAAGVVWPDRLDSFPGGRVLVYVATPAIWPQGWRIPEPPGARLVAAATGQPQPVATSSPRRDADRGGWRASRALRWAVPAGSVYLLQFGGELDEAEAHARTWARKVHGTAYLPAAAELDHDDQAQTGSAADGLTDLVGQRLRTAGFGVVLTGVWT